MITTAELRQSFLEFFNEKGHQTIPSASLVPVGDQTLLFTNAGMVPFKDYFLGNATPPSVRATSSQRCVRAGGKHNDLENVGHTARHHTFFEMLGNFSFGDYFKREAIQYSWEYLTKVLKLPEENLWITVFEEDDEAADIWLKELGVSAERFSRIGAHDNFWAMGNTGPCGPCSEIFYDHGDGIPGGPPGTPEEDGDRYVEIWNLVFMQYDRDESGKKHPLPKPSVDTGMGLERLAAVMQGVHENYQIDLFQGLLKAAAKITQTSVSPTPASLKVIVDHIRSCAFLIMDGVQPSNEGRGYVLRRIIRRAIRHGFQLGIKKEPFFFKMVTPLVEQMGDAYPELARATKNIEKILKKEEEKFSETLEQGMAILGKCIAALTNDTIPGEIAFKLYDTYGFPVDLTADVAREHNLTVDMGGFEKAMAEQKTRARAASQFGGDYVPVMDAALNTEFLGYAGTLFEGCKVLALYKGEEAVEQLSEGDHGVVLLDKTSFYAESGGQVGDQGSLLNEQSDFSVIDTKKWGKTHAHMGAVSSGTIKLGDLFSSKVDEAKRSSIARHHSATHLLHAALRQVLGSHVTQKGSLVDGERLRFDFSHDAPAKFDELQSIQRIVNQQIAANNAVQTNVMAYDDAVKSGAMALFGEKYEDDVRVLRMGDFSVELCGGTHVKSTGEIGLFKLLSEGGVASGVRRIEAVAGSLALDHMENNEATLNALGQTLKAVPEQVQGKVEQLLERTKQLEKELSKMQQAKASQQSEGLGDNAIDLGDVRLLTADVTGVNAKSMRDLMDKLRDKLAPAVIVLGTASDDKVSMIVGVSKECTDRFKAGELVSFVASQVGGKGGGRPDMAQAGGNQPENLAAALASVESWIKERQ